MSASRTIFSRVSSAASVDFKELTSKYISLALSVGLLVAPAAMAVPASHESAKSNESASVKAADTSSAKATEKASSNAGPTADVKAAAPGSLKASVKTSAGDEATETVSSTKAGEATPAGAVAEKSEDTSLEAKPGSVLETAEELRDETAEQANNRAISHWNLARLYMGQWDLELAQTELDLAILSWPSMQVAHRDQCLVSLMKLNLMRSVAEFMMTVGLGEPIPMSDEEANSLIENGMVQHYKKGLAYTRQQKWKDAAVELEWAANLGPEDFAIQRSLAFTYANMGDFNRAETHYKRTFELAPHDGSSRADLAYFLADNGKLSEAEKALEDAIKVQPKATAYHVDLSFMAEKRGDLDTASRELQTALELNPKHADLWVHLGRVLEKKGDTTQAQDAFKKALLIDPSMAEAQNHLVKPGPEA